MPTDRALPHEDVPHPNGDDRYAIYGGRRRIAETSLDGIGSCLVTLLGEDQINGSTAVGIFDRVTREWIVNPWATIR